jgi:uncharacterized protein (DUF2237 family)
MQWRETAMLRDDKSGGGRQRRSPRNVLGEPLDICSIKPTTGFYRDGCCNTGREDIGSHRICVVMTIAFSKLEVDDGLLDMERWTEMLRDVGFGSSPKSAEKFVRSLLRIE